jgi:hypothetical protein
VGLVEDPQALLLGDPSRAGGLAPEDLRIGLTQGKDSIRLEAQDGPVEIRLGDAQTGTQVATVPAGETWRFVPSPTST